MRVDVPVVNISTQAGKPTTTLVSPTAVYTALEAT
jgi:hypothetical protein